MLKAGNKKEITEKQVEEQTCKYAKEKKVLVYKFTSPGRRAVPDRLFVYCGKVMLIEFKKPGKKPTALQVKEANKLREQHIPVFFVDDPKDGKEVVYSFLIKNQNYMVTWSLLLHNHKS